MALAGCAGFVSSDCGRDTSAELTGTHETLSDNEREIVVPIHYAQRSPAQQDILSDALEEGYRTCTPPLAAFDEILHLMNQRVHDQFVRATHMELTGTPPAVADTAHLRRDGQYYDLDARVKDAEYA